MDEDGRLRARAEALLDIHRADEASRLLERLLAQSPDDVGALCLAARAQLELDHRTAACDLARRAVALAPDAEWPLRLLALSAGQLGRTTEAWSAANAAVAAAPWAWQTHHVMAQVAMDLPGRTSEAFAAARQAVALGPNEPTPHTTLGTLALKHGDKKTARAAFQEALRLDPSNAAALNELGRLHLQRRNAVGAALHFAQAARSNSRLSAPAQNIDIALTAAAARVFNCAWIVLIFPARFAALLSGQDARLAAYVTLALLVALMAWQAWVLRPLLRGGLRTYLVTLPHRDRQLTVIAGLTVIGIVALAVMCVVPVAVRWPFLLVSAVVLVIARVVLGRRRGRLRRRRSA